MDIFLIILSFVLLAGGIVGSIMPGLPGPPLSWVGLLLAGFTKFFDSTPTLLITTAAVCIVITVLDYLIPSLSTKRFGGTKAGVWGCNIGLIISIIGLPFGPQGLIGVVLWPFVGAFVGEYFKQHDAGTSLKAAWGAFMGFLSGTLLKVVYGVALMVVVIAGMV